MVQPLDMTNKGFMIVGPRGSGKTNLSKYFLSLQANHLVYDPMLEYEGYNRYQPDDRYSKDELDLVIDHVQAVRPRLFIVDEGNRYFEPHPKPLTRSQADINDFSRHWGVSWGLLSRRPVQVSTQVTEIVDRLFVFRLTGRNDRAFFDAKVVGLGEVVAGLADFHFLVLDQQGDYYVHNPVPLQKVTPLASDGTLPPDKP